jgi:hypothetical protein
MKNDDNLNKYVTTTKRTLLQTHKKKIRFFNKMKPKMISIKRPIAPSLLLVLSFFINLVGDYLIGHFDWLFMDHWIG